MEIGKVDNIIQRGKSILIKDLSENDAVTYFHVRKTHLEEVVNQLWLSWQYFLSDPKGDVKIEMRNAVYHIKLLPTCFLQAYMTKTPTKENGIPLWTFHTGMSWAINFIIHAMNALEGLCLKAPEIFH